MINVEGVMDTGKKQRGKYKNMAVVREREALLCLPNPFLQQTSGQIFEDDVNVFMDGCSVRSASYIFPSLTLMYWVSF